MEVKTDKHTHKRQTHLVMRQTAATTTSRKTPTPTPMGTSLLSEEPGGVVAAADGKRDAVTGDDWTSKISK